VAFIVLKKEEEIMATLTASLLAVIGKQENEIIARWLELQSTGQPRMSRVEGQDTERQSREFLAGLKLALQRGGTGDIFGPEWASVREVLTNFSATRAKNGYTPSETASLILSLKEPLFLALRNVAEAEVLADAIWSTTQLLDKLGIFTMEVYQKAREGIISRQQQELLELSTPVVRLWDNILALPLIGTLDSARTQVVMENLLDAIVQTRSDFAIIDITGVPVVDTLVAQHLLKTVAAARLMGADCMISGIRPQIAQTIIHLGVDLTDVITKATLADAFALALRRGGNTVVREDKNKTAR
jgi:rsbT co-antagonist protein RsbR